MSAQGFLEGSTEDISYERHASALLKSASEIARELRTSAAAREGANAQPFAEIDLLRRARLLEALEPRDFGGSGLSWPQALRIVREIAAGDTSIGQLLGYHYSISRFVLIGGRPGQYEQVSRRAASERWLWADAVDPLGPDIVLTRDGDGFRANGFKDFSTGASVADAILIVVKLDGKPGTAIIPKGRKGLRFDRSTRDHLGQRQTESGRTVLENVRIEADEIVGYIPAPEGEAPAISTLAIPFVQAAFSSFYLGAARGALTDAAHYVKTTTRPWLHSGVSRAVDDPYIIERFGELEVALLSAETLLDRAAEQLQAALILGPRLTQRQRGEAAVTTYAAKVQSTRVALDITSRIYEVQGARSTSRRYDFDRRWRDVRTHTLHDPVVYKTREVGDFALNDNVPEPDGGKYR
jgi:alkylation response protein AidB-like acyl-CoA dehydrogenase